MIKINDLSFKSRNKPLLFWRPAIVIEQRTYLRPAGQERERGKPATLLKNITGLAFPEKGNCLFNGVNVSNRPVSVLGDVYFIAEELFVPALTPAQFVSNYGGLPIQNSAKAISIII